MDHELKLERWWPVLLASVILAVSSPTHAQSLYKYRDDNGQWIYTDRRPEDGAAAEVLSLKTAPGRATVTVVHALSGGEMVFMARNEFHAPVEIAIQFEDIAGIGQPQPDSQLRWVVPPRSDLVLLNLPVLGNASAPRAEYRVAYLPGDPASVHRNDEGYRVPFVAGRNFPVTQAYPDAKTHRTDDSKYAIDIAMPVGTDVLAARSGIVFDVVSKNFRGGALKQALAQLANIVRILHDDGTYAVYAHLNWDSIRVRPGERVQAGQYIADSGNTGFSSGPHLHFAVQRNAGMRIEAVPLVFRGRNLRNVVPETGAILTAYH